MADDYMMPAMIPQPVPSLSGGQNQHGASIQMLTNPENDLYKLELTLRGMVLDSNDEPKLAGEALLNDKGVCSMMGHAQSLVSQTTIMSNLDSKEIGIMMEFAADTLAYDLMINRKMYGINNPAARTKIFHHVLSKSFIAMKRAFEEGDRRFWKGSQQDIRTVVQNDSQKKGIFGLIGSLKNK